MSIIANRGNSSPSAQPDCREEGSYALNNLPDHLAEYLKLAPPARNSPSGRLWAGYKQKADVLHIHSNAPGRATDSEPTGDAVIVRYEGDEIIGLTILHASWR